MPTLKQIRRRIGTVRNIGQITRAMKMVAAARLRRAQENMMKARPYTFRLKEAIEQLVLRTGSEDHPLLAKRKEKKVLLFIITSDRGLCGSFNTNISKKAENYIRKNELKHEEFSISVIGKKGRDYFRRRKYNILREYMEVLHAPSLDKITTIGEEIISDFIDGDLDAVYLVYNEFKSSVQQQVIMEKLLPLHVGKSEYAERTEFLYEPSKEKILNTILPLYIKILIYHAVLESLAAEMGARMTSMESATNNAVQLIQSLTLQYNKARQAAITKELMEIIGGAEAQK
jgi:F-type H+-transporting ATPase subunit gamma